MTRHILVLAIVLNLWVSIGVAAEQTEAGELEPAASIQKKDAPTLNEARVVTDEQAKEREWKKVEKELQQLAAVIEEESRIIRQATRECETKNKGDGNSETIFDGKEISRQLDGYSQRIRECIALKEGCEAAIAGFSDLSQKMQSELQEANNEYTRCTKSMADMMRKNNDTKDNIIGNIK